MKGRFSTNYLRDISKDELIKLILSQQTEIEKLKAALEESQRSGKRQASPFSKGKSKKEHKKPGRKSGKDHGEHHRGKIPPKVDFKINVPIKTGLMDQDGNPLCPDCHEQLEDFEIHTQYQTDIPPPQKPIVTQFNVEVARCPCCDQRFQGRDPQQTSDALYAANTQVGPNVLSLASELKYGFGLSFEKIADYFLRTHKIKVSRSTLCRASQRLAEKSMPSFQNLVFSIRRSRVVCADETGWRINGDSAWLWVFSAEGVTVYLVDPTRGHEVAEKVLGKEFQGTLSTDGYLAYDAMGLPEEKRQQCNSHLLNRCKKLRELKTNRAVVFSKQVSAILKAGIALHKNHAQYTTHGFLVKRGKIESAMDRVLSKQLTDPDNARFAKHLMKHRESLFTYLYDPKHEINPTNNEAERETRPAVIMRKLGACNRSVKGAKTTSVLATVIRSCKKRAVSFTEKAVNLLRIQHPDDFVMFETSG